MENVHKRISVSHNLVKDLPDDSKELPKFLASCKAFFKIINPVDETEINHVIEFLKQKLNSNIFLNFQNKDIKNLEEFETALKNHYLRKVSSYNFYIDIMSLKQKNNENVRSFVNRLTDKKNEFLFRNQPGELKLDEILIQALTNGLEPRLRLFAQLKDGNDFDILVQNIEDVECKFSTQSNNELNVADIFGH